MVRVGEQTVVPLDVIFVVGGSLHQRALAITQSLFTPMLMPLASHVLLVVNNSVMSACPADSRLYAVDMTARGARILPLDTMLQRMSDGFQVWRCRPNARVCTKHARYVLDECWGASIRGQVAYEDNMAAQLLCAVGALWPDVAAYGIRHIMIQRGYDGVYGTRQCYMTCSEYIASIYVQLGLIPRGAVRASPTLLCHLLGTPVIVFRPPSMTGTAAALSYMDARVVDSRNGRPAEHETVKRIVLTRRVMCAVRVLCGLIPLAILLFSFIKLRLDGHRDLS